MRYQNWDVLVFPELSKVPQQEFKTACQVVQDYEYQSMQNGPLLPTVTSFIPGLAAGEGFRISIHSWHNPEMSRYIASLKRPTDTVIFEARLFIDGKLAGSRWFHSLGPWPTIIDQSIEMDKRGEYEKLKFPAFHRELLMQSYWNAGDDLGRVKVVISEGFAREHLAYPFERVRNIVSFSFQHAPLDVLESSAIAWPNASMWRQFSAIGPYMSQTTSPRPIEAVEGHSHSPRHLEPKAVWSNAAVSQSAFPTPTAGAMPPPSAAFTRPPINDPFTGPVNSAFKGWRQREKTDESMPDYASSSHSRSMTSSRNVSDPMQIVNERRPMTMSMEGAYDSLCEGLLPPANTPQTQTAAGTPSAPALNRTPSITMLSVAGSAVGPADRETEPLREEPVAVSNGASILNERLVKLNNAGEIQDVAIIDERKRPRSTASSRRTSQSVTVSGVKRPRNVTPAASKVIDDTDEPRSSPIVKQLTRGDSKADENKENERQVLADIENVA